MESSPPETPRISFYFRTDLLEIKHIFSSELGDFRSLSLYPATLMEQVDQVEEVGIKVVSIDRGSIIDEANMIPDYIITHINGEKVSSADEFIAKLETLKGKVLLDGYYQKYQGDFPYSFLKE